MTEFPMFSKSFGIGDTETFEINGRKTYAISYDKKTNMIEIVLIPTLRISKLNNFNYTITFTFLCWSFSFTYWRIKWMKN
jgi:hypothetical protein